MLDLHSKFAALRVVIASTQHLSWSMLKPPFECLQVQMALSSLSATLQAAKGRLDALEQMRIPTLEERLQEVSRTSAQVGFARVCHVQYHYTGVASC